LKVLVIGGGGREHALVDSMSREHDVKVYCAPGNAGIAGKAEIVDLKADDIFPLLRFVDDNKVDLTVVGPEQPLAAGLVDAFESRGKKVFGPRKLAARLETSKVFAKEFMRRWKIPTAGFRTFTIQQQNELLQYLKRAEYPLVLKADGLAAGKGVSIVQSSKEAEGELERLFVKKIFGGAGERVVVEEFMAGIEASVFAVTDGKDFVVLPPAQDHKRVGDNDTGKNTGGMGAFAPTPFVSDSDMDVIRRMIIEKAIEGTAAEGFPFKGCLYCGIMLTSDGPKVVEFNVRFGDPETQAVLQLVDSSVLQLLEASATRKVGSYQLKLNSSASVCVIAASKGYPDYHETGKEIRGLEVESELTKVLHSGTKFAGGKIVTSGGRVLGVTATDSGGRIKRASELAYNRLSRIQYDGIFFRRDIGKKAIELEEKKGQVR
jgi:phosphoribosylamine---glycine ligase